MFVVFLFPTSPQTSAPEMNYSVVVLGGVLILSLVWYYFPVYGGVHWFTGPVRNVEEEVSGKESVGDVQQIHVDSYSSYSEKKDDSSE